MEDELAGKSDKASFNTTVGDATFTFLFRLLTGKDPTETKIGIDGPILVQTWLAAPKLMVFLFQKSALYKCNMAGKPAVLTRVVDSMTDNLRPTRVEATGVANAILDGSDAILLGAETLRGLYPVEIISTVGRICSEDHKLVISSESERLVSLLNSKQSLPPWLKTLQRLPWLKTLQRLRWDPLSHSRWISGGARQRVPGHLAWS